MSAHVLLNLLNKLGKRGHAFLAASNGKNPVPYNTIC